MLGLKNLLKFRSSRVKQWKNIPSELPWFDHPNALVLLEQRRKAESLWIRNSRPFEIGSNTVTSCFEMLCR